MNDAPVRLEVGLGVATLTLDQPETRNALTPELLRGLRDGLARAETTPGVRIVVLTHTGPVFCAGADLRARRPPGIPPTAQEESHLDPARPGVGELPAVLRAIADCPLPVVARLGGHAFGGGVGLAAVCDISVAADGVLLGFTEVRLGVIPAVVSLVCLPKLRRGDALELFLTGERITARRAADAGLITRAVPAHELDAAARHYVHLLGQGGPHALSEAKALVYRRAETDVDAAYRAMTALSARLFSSEEAAEGRAAFHDKRPAAWVPKVMAR
jgi:methylglutaconyl-CoA hydratase